MDILTLLISRVNDVLWTYILIIMLLGCAFWFTFKTNFVQFRMIREMIRLKMCIYNRLLLNIL